MREITLPDARIKNMDLSKIDPRELLKLPLCQAYGVQGEIACNQALGEYPHLRFILSTLSDHIKEKAAQGINTFNDTSDTSYGRYAKERKTAEGHDALVLSFAVPEATKLAAAIKKFQLSGKDTYIPKVDKSLFEEAGEAFDRLFSSTSTLDAMREDKEIAKEQMLASLKTTSGKNKNSKAGKAILNQEFNDNRIFALLSTRQIREVERDAAKFANTTPDQLGKVSGYDQAAFGVSLAGTRTVSEMQNMTGIAAEWMSEYINCRGCAEWGKIQQRLSEKTMLSLGTPEAWHDAKTTGECFGSTSCMADAIASFGFMLGKAYLAGEAVALIPRLQKAKLVLGSFAVTGQGAGVGLLFAVEGALRLKQQIEKGLLARGVSNSDAAKISGRIAIVAGALTFITGSVGYTGMLYGTEAAGIAQFQQHFKNNALQTYSQSLINSALAAYGQNNDEKALAIIDRAMTAMYRDLGQATIELVKMSGHGLAKSATPGLRQQTALLFQKFKETHTVTDYLREAQSEIEGLKEGRVSGTVLHDGMRAEVLSNNASKKTATLIVMDEKTGKPVRTADGRLKVLQDVPVSQLEITAHFNELPPRNTPVALLTEAEVNAINPDAVAEMNAAPRRSLADLERVFRDRNATPEMLAKALEEAAEINQISLAQRVLDPNATPANLLARGLAHPSPLVQAAAFDAMMRSGNTAVRRMIPRLAEIAIKKGDSVTLERFAIMFADGRNVDAFRPQDLNALLSTLNRLVNHPTFSVNPEIRRNLTLGLMRMLEAPGMQAAIATQMADSAFNRLLSQPTIALIRDTLKLNHIEPLNTTFELTIKNLHELAKKSKDVSPDDIAALRQLETKIKSDIALKITTREEANRRAKEAETACAISFAQNDSIPAKLVEVASSRMPAPPSDLEQIQWLFGLAQDPSGS